MPSPQGEGEGRGKRGGRREGGSQAPSCSGKHNNRQGFKEAAGSGIVDSELPLFTPLSPSLSVFRKVGEKGHTDHAFFPTVSTGLPATSTDAATPPGPGITLSWDGAGGAVGAGGCGPAAELSPAAWRSLWALQPEANRPDPPWGGGSGERVSLSAVIPPRAQMGAV